MNKILIITAAIALSGCSLFNMKSSTPPSIYEFSDNITEEGLYADLSVLAHDSLQGRDTGTEGLQKAAKFLAEKYEEAGLIPVGDDSTYFQSLELSQPIIESVEFTVTTANGDSIVDASTHSKEEVGNFVTLYGGSDSSEGEIVFIGKGTSNDAEGINQFPEDMEGKWLMLFVDRAATNMQQVQTAMQSAAGVISITDDANTFTQQAVARQAAFGNGGRMQLTYLQEESNTGQISPAFVAINPELAATLLGLENMDALVQLKEEISADPAAFEPQPLDYALELNPAVDDNIIESKNVVAFLEGSDPELKDEVVVLSSHYDHVGIGQPDSTGDALYNGADDDGSGTVATLHTALAMAKAKEAGSGPKRSVLFLHVTAEEKGLLGSRYYSDHPIFPIENTIANINIDMIGRVDAEHEQDSNYVYIIGGEIISSGLDSLTQVANEMGPNLTLSKRYNDLEDPNQFYRRSDHWNFGRLGVPFVFFFNGVHPDYHRPSDEIQNITIGPLTKRTHLVYNLTAILANADERPVVDNQEFIDKTQVQPR